MCILTIGPEQSACKARTYQLQLPGDVCRLRGKLSLPMFSQELAYGYGVAGSVRQLSVNKSWSQPNCPSCTFFSEWGRAQCIIESKVQWQRFWLATQQYPQNYWLGGNFCILWRMSFVWRSAVTSRETLSNGTNWSASRCYYDLCARPPLRLMWRRGTVKRRVCGSVKKIDRQTMSWKHVSPSTSMSLTYNSRVVCIRTVLSQPNWTTANSGSLSKMYCVLAPAKSYIDELTTLTCLCFDGTST